jgi:uncharacterized protein (TIGR03435 family)
MLKGLFAVLLAIVTASVASIEVTGQALAFDVASVRENRSGLIPSRFEITRGGELRIVNMPLRDIIRRAYGIYVRGPRPFAPVEHEPAWAGERYDVLAKADLLPANGPRGMLLGDYADMLQTLLAERFELAVRWTTREQPVYVLTLAREDGQFGPGLSRPRVDCSPSSRKPDADLSEDQITQLLARCGLRGSGTSLQAIAPLSSLIDVLTTRLMRPVIDRTGLEGSFDISLTWRPDGVPGAASGAAVSGTEPPAVDLAEPTLPDAIEEQLGLRLERVSAPMEVLVIERIERLVPE